MREIMIDATTKLYRRYVIRTFYYCDYDKYPQGKIIDPTTDHDAQGKIIDPTTDHDAHKTSNGDWKCESLRLEDYMK